MGLSVMQRIRAAVSTLGAEVVRLPRSGVALNRRRWKKRLPAVCLLSGWRSAVSKVRAATVSAENRGLPTWKAQSRRERGRHFSGCAGVARLRGGCVSCREMTRSARRGAQIPVIARDWGQLIAQMLLVQIRPAET